MGQLSSSSQCDSRGYEGTYFHLYGDIDIAIHVIAVVMLLTSLTILLSSILILMILI